jgi:hypothetical protein
MAAELLTGLGIFKSMLDTAKGLKDINDTAVRNAAVIELQEKILAAQAQQTALIERVGELEKEVARFETWETEKQRYKLERLPDGGVVYALKESESGGEPPHRICASCYQERRRSFLQTEHWQPMGCEVLVCHTCAAVVYAKGHPHADHKPLRPTARR